MSEPAKDEAVAEAVEVLARNATAARTKLIVIKVMRSRRERFMWILLDGQTPESSHG
jgi:hypothetical protein